MSLADELFAYGARRADAETARRIEADLEDPQSEIRRFIDAVGRKSRGGTPAPGDERFRPAESDADESGS